MFGKHPMEKLADALTDGGLILAAEEVCNWWFNYYAPAIKNEIARLENDFNTLNELYKAKNEKA